MVARIAELIVKPVSAAALSDTIATDAAVLVGRCRGFRGHLVMALKGRAAPHPDCELLGFKVEVAEFEQEIFEKIRSLERPFLVGGVRVRMFAIMSHMQVLQHVINAT